MKRERVCGAWELVWEREGGRRKSDRWDRWRWIRTVHTPRESESKSCIVFFEIEIDESERGLWDWDIWVLFLFWNLVIILLINGFRIVVIIKKDLEICDDFRDLYYASDSVSVSLSKFVSQREKKKVVFRSSERTKNRERRRRRILVLFTSSGNKRRVVEPATGNALLSSVFLFFQLKPPSPDSVFCFRSP